MYFLKYSGMRYHQTFFPPLHMSYVDGFVIPIPKKNLRAYKKMATEASKIWMKHGALDYKECVADDMKVKDVLPFSTIAKMKSNETVIFAYIVFKSRKHRDRVNAKVMAYFEKKYAQKKDQSMPFDPKRIAYSGFKTIVQV